MALFGPTGERIAYEVWRGPGGAPALLLLPGFTETRELFAANLAGLSERFTVVTVDLLGHGAADAPAATEAYAPAKAADRVAALATFLGFERFLVCGHAIGGSLALRIALGHPARVVGAVVVNNTSAALGTAAWRTEMQARMAELAAMVRAEGMSTLQESRLSPARSRRLPAEAQERLLRAFEALSPAGVAGAAEGYVANVLEAERLGDLRCPVLVLAGARARGAAEAGERLAAAVPNARVVELEGLGFTANIEDPAAFNAALFAFAERIGAIRGPGFAGRHRTGLVFVAGSLVVAAVSLGAAALYVANQDDGGTDDNDVVATLTPTPPGGTSTTAAAASTTAGTPTPTPGGTATPTVR
jgi:pimeloyl-ACP methyl ester carboxylesterase